MKRILSVLLITLFSVSFMACSLSSNETTENNQNMEQNEINDNNEPSNSNHIESKDNHSSPNIDDKSPSVSLSIESGKGGFLWRVDNNDTTVYLQGTIHIGTEDFYPLNDLIEDAYESSDIVVPEVDITEVDILSSIGATFTHGVYYDGTTIKDHISSEVYEKLENVLNQYELPLDLVGYFKPWLLDATITQLVAQELNFFHGIDMYFLEKAKEDGKEIIELESVEDQYDVLAGQSPKFQERQLEETLDSLEHFEGTMLEVFSIYLNGDPDQLITSLFPDESEMDEEYRDYIKALNDDRNVKMAEKIGEFLKEDTGKTYFVIVGTAHLVKEPHIRTFLEEEGYNIKHVY